jgi:Flp pilus assembly protein TadD
MLVSPRDPSMPMWNNLFVAAELDLGRYDAAMEACKKAIDVGYHVFHPYLNLAAADALKGDDSDAKAALDEARRSTRGFPSNGSANIGLCSSPRSTR